MHETEIKKIIQEYLAKYEPLDFAVRNVSYEYNKTGDKKLSEEEARLQLEIRKLNSDRKRFAELKKIYDERYKIGDFALRRQAEDLYLNHLPSQISDDKLKKLTELEKRIAENFNDYRAEVDGKKLTPVDVAHILSDSKDSAELEKVWKGAHLVAPLLEHDYRELVNLRNSIANDLGFKDALELTSEITQVNLQMLDKFYNDVVEATESAFLELKEKFIDPKLAARYRISEGELSPWHYQDPFFQEAPTSIFGKIDLDSFYSKIDSNELVKIATEFYRSIGIDVSGILKNSSLFPKEGKNPHAFAEALDLGRPGSSILLMNLPEVPKAPKASDGSTLIHELAHDINFEATLANPKIPFLLRNPTMLTEAFAMLMEKQTQTKDWFLRLSASIKAADDAVAKMEEFDYVDQLVFLRWSAAIYKFERKFYSDPNCDIGDLWWECKEKYQFLRRPKNWKNPDAIAKYHIPNVVPLYYSNYAIGRVANVQFAELFARKIGVDVRGASYFGKKELGDWLMKDFLAHGDYYRWEDFLIRTTGKPLSVEAWKKYYIDGYRTH